MSPSNLHVAWARLFVHALASSGVREAVSSPGSRSTPLALALAETTEIRTHVIVDERSAAFFALGQARMTGRPSLLVCTSGTAGAHYYPAILEAEASYVPLLAVTADRPWELHACAASQTLAQTDLFVGHVRAAFDLGLPDPNAMSAVPRIAAQSVHRSIGPTPGPVHVNARFRKPLEPVDAGVEPWQATYDALFATGAPRIARPIGAIDAAALDALAERITRAERGLFVCGPSLFITAADRAAVFALAALTGFLLVAEATSQLRFAPAPPGVTRLAHADELFRCAEFRSQHVPDLIVQLGAPPLSAGYAEVVVQAAPHRVAIAPHGHPDPWSNADDVINAGIGDVARALLERVPRRNGTAWAAAFAKADALVEAIVADETKDEQLGEGSIAREVVDALGDGSVLVVGNSTPVRDLDAYCPCADRHVDVVHQRGAAGIDGLVSGAAGVRSATDAPVTLFLGDVSLAHDLAALQVLARSERPTTVVVVQNGGGRIFDELPVAAAAPDVVERFFATPQAIDLCAVATALGVTSTRVETRTSLREALRQAAMRSAPTLVEAVAPPHEGARRKRRIAERIAAATRRTS